MLGFGAFLAGMGLAGFDVQPLPGAPRNIRPPVALRFDNQLRDFPLDENGYYKASHPIDQEVSLALSVSRGAVASASAVGNKLRTISRVNRTVAEALARIYIRDGLASLTSAKSIELQGIEIDLSVPGRLLFAVTYMNLELAYVTGNKPRTVTAELAYA